MPAPGSRGRLVHHEIVGPASPHCLTTQRRGHSPLVEFVRPFSARHPGRGQHMTSVGLRLLTAAGAALMMLAPGKHLLHAQATVGGRVTIAGGDQPLSDARIVVIGSTASSLSAD